MSKSQGPSNPVIPDKLDRIRTFERTKIFHHHLNKYTDDCSLYIEYLDEPTIILLFGPSGVGKTTLLENLIQKIIKNHEAEMVADPGHIPVAYVLTMPPASGSSIGSIFTILRMKAWLTRLPIAKHCTSQSMRWPNII